MLEKIKKVLKNSTDFFSIGEGLKKEKIDYEFIQASVNLPCCLYKIGNYIIAPKQYADDNDIIVNNYLINKTK